MRPRVVWSDFYFHLKMFFRSRSTLMWTLFFPIMMMLLFGAIFWNMDDVNVTVYVQDNDDSQLSKEFVAGLDEAFSIEEIPADVDAKDYIEEHDIKAAVVIPEGFQDEALKTMANRTYTFQQFAMMNSSRFGYNFTEFKALGEGGPGNTTIVLYTDPTSGSTTGIVTTVVNGMAQGNNMYLSLAPNTINVDPKDALSDEYKYIDFFMPGVIGMTLMQAAIYGAVLRNTKYRQMGILRKLTTTPIKKSEYIMAKMLFMVFTGFLSCVLIIFVGVVVFGVGIHVNGYVLLLIPATSFAFAGMGMIISNFIHEEETADSAAGVITFPMMFLAGTFWPLEMMPGVMQTIAQALPLYYVNEGLRASMILDDPTSALTNTGVVLALAVVFFGIGVALTSWKEK